MRQLALLMLFFWGFTLSAQTPFQHKLETTKLPWTNKSFDNADEKC